MKKISTKVTKILDFNHIDYELFTYSEERLSGIEIANILKEDPKLVFKTLLTKDNKNKFHIFVIPVNKELDLKKCAKFINEKSVEMAHEKEMKPITGYIHGGCSMIGLIKNIDITVDSSFITYPFIYISAGEIGKQIKINPLDIKRIIYYKVTNITKE